MTKWTPANSKLALPVLGAPMFLISGPELVIAQCKAGIVGSLPALNARPTSLLDEWLTRIETELAAYDAAHPDAPSAPFAINLIVHRTNAELEEHVKICIDHKVPIVITSFGVRADVNDSIRGYGGITLHDIATLEHSHKAIERGASGLIAVAGGAGGHAGAMSPIALIGEIREWFDGPLLLAGVMSTGQSVLAAQMLGADMAYLGTRFIPATECLASDGHKQMILDSEARDIVYTDKISGTNANFLLPSLIDAGIALDGKAPNKEDGPAVVENKAWKDVWSAGQGVGQIHKMQSTAEIVAQLTDEYRVALAAANDLGKLYG